MGLRKSIFSLRELVTIFLSCVFLVLTQIVARADSASLHPRQKSETDP